MWEYSKTEFRPSITEKWEIRGWSIFWLLSFTLKQRTHFSRKTKTTSQSLQLRQLEQHFFLYQRRNNLSIQKIREFLIHFYSDKVLMNDRIIPSLQTRRQVIRFHGNFFQNSAITDPHWSIFGYFNHVYDVFANVFSTEKSSIFHFHIKSKAFSNEFTFDSEYVWIIPWP